MALPEKNYYSLCDVGERWRVSPQDVRYYAENGLLEIQTWLPEIIVKLFRNKKTEDGEIAPVQIGVSDYKGYAIVEPDELRKILRNSPRPVNRFKCPGSGDPIKIFDPRTRFMVAIEDLVVSKTERDRFEKQHEISIASENIRAEKIHLPSFAGRPSLMARVIKEFEVRCTQNCLEPSLLREGKVLSAWAAENIDSEQTPKPRTIMNAIRPKYREHIEKQLQLS